MATLNTELAMQAHSGTSHVPDERGRMVIDGYNSHIAAIRADFMKGATTPEEIDFIDEQMRSLASGYASKMNAQLATQSGCMSTMIAGPSGFNTSQAEKRNRAYRNKVEATDAFLTRAIAAIWRDLNKMQVAAAGGEIEVMRTKLQGAEEAQELMKAVNRVMRSKKLSDDEKSQQVQTKHGLSEQLVHELMHPDWGRPGFAPYQLSNNNANIRRMRVRIEEMEAREATPTSDIKFDGGSIIDNCEDDRVQIDFDEKPGDEMCATLRGSGWRWAPSLVLWQRKRTRAAMLSAKEILGVN